MSPTGRTAIVVEGGAMRGVFSAGVLDLFHEERFHPFDLALGVSAGACNLASHLAGQHGRNRRAKLQLRLQETVEGLAVVAITYYGSQLVQYLAKGAKDVIVPATPEVVTAASIPLIAGLVALGLRRLRRQLAAEDGGGGH